MKPIRKAVRTFLINNDKVVAIKYTTEKNKGFYDIPGGKIEDDESSKSAAIREFKEETTMNILNPKYAGNLIVEYPDRIFDFDIYLALEYEGKPTKAEENTSLWIDINELLAKKKKFAEIYVLDEEHRDKLLNLSNFKRHFLVDENHNKIKEMIYVNNKSCELEYNDKDYEKISPTAIITSYPRTFTDIPYEKEIYKWLEENCNRKVTLCKNLAPEIEARYKLINKLLEKYEIKQVLELAAGYSSRGLFYSQKGYNYVELDLENVTKNKKKIVCSIEKNIPKNLNIISGNALKNDDFKMIESYFKTDEPIAVINEGLLRYLTFDEKRQIAQNIYALLSKYDGVWITSDVTPKKFISSQNKAHQDLNENLNNITSRNDINDRFEDINHIRKFFGNIGFELIEVHKFNEMKDELYSINKLNIFDEKIEKTLEDAIVVVLMLKNKKHNKIGDK